MPKQAEKQRPKPGLHPPPGSHVLGEWSQPCRGRGGTLVCLGSGSGWKTVTKRSLQRVLHFRPILRHLGARIHSCLFGLKPLWIQILSGGMYFKTWRQRILIDKFPTLARSLSCPYTHQVTNSIRKETLQKSECIGPQETDYWNCYIRT